jgi:hypothetical protein
LHIWRIIKKKFRKISSLSVDKKGFHITDHFFFDSNSSLAIYHPLPHNTHTRLQNLLELVNGAAQVVRYARVANVNY